MSTHQRRQKRTYSGYGKTKAEALRNMAIGWAEDPQHGGVLVFERFLLNPHEKGWIAEGSCMVTVTIRTEAMP
jgi:hypothetical protein